MTDHNTPRIDDFRDEIDCRIALTGIISVAEIRDAIDFARQLERELVACRAALRELVAIDVMPGVVPMNAIHHYQCPCTRHGQSFGPCDCAGTGVDARIDRAWIAARKLAGDNHD